MMPPPEPPLRAIAWEMRDGSLNDYRVMIIEEYFIIGTNGAERRDRFDYRVERYLSPAAAQARAVGVTSLLEKQGYQIHREPRLRVIAENNNTRAMLENLLDFEGYHSGLNITYRVTMVRGASLEALV